MAERRTTGAKPAAKPKAAPKPKPEQEPSNDQAGDETIVPRSNAGVAPGAGGVPEGEARVTRRQAKKDPEYWYGDIEHIPKEWGLPDKVKALLERKLPDGSPLGAEIVGDKDAQMVRVRIPMKNYQAIIRDAERKSEERRRAKTPGATIDKSTRTTLDLAALQAGDDEKAGTKMLTDAGVELNK